MDQPPDLPPPLLIEPPEMPQLPEAPTRRPSKPPVAAVLAGILAFAVMGVVGLGFGRRLAARMFDAKKGDALASIDPYQTVKDAYVRNKRQFRVGLARGSELALRRQVPQASITFDPEADVEDVGGVLRATVGYRGTLPLAGQGMSAVEGQQRRYFHSGGLIIVDALCLTADSMCISRDELLRNTETAVMANLNDTGVEALLPADASCQPVDVLGVAGVNHLTLCKLGDDLTISLQRLSLGEARRQLAFANNDPELRDAAEGIVRDNP